MKTLLVTDPCYLISDSEWSDACKLCFSKEADDDTPQLKKFKNFIQDLLVVVSGDQKALAEDTGYGDWENCIDGQSFYADSGMVCIVEETPKLTRYMQDNHLVEPLGGIAHIKVENETGREIDTSDPQWSVVKIKDGNRVIRSLGPGIPEYS